MRKRKLCIITSVHDYNDRRIFDREAMTLLKSGYSIDIIAPTGKDVFVYQGINIIGIPKLPKMLRPLNWFMILAHCFSGKYDLFHFHDPDLLLVGIILKIFSNGSVIYDVHEHYPDRIMIYAKRNNFIANLLRFLIRALENVAARIVRNLVVVEDTQYQRFSRLGCNVQILYNYARLDQYPGFDNGRSYDRKVVLHTGTLSVARGALQLVEIVRGVTAKRNDIAFLFVDRFLSEVERKILIGKIQDAGLEQHFRFIPQVPVEQMPTILEQGDIGISLLLPVGQYHKAIPTKFFEYMAEGLAIIAENSYYSRKFIQESNCGILCDYDDIDGFVARIIRLCENPELTKKLGLNGRNAFESRYNWNCQEAALEQYYRDILESH